MLGKQKKMLAQAESEHQAAVERKAIARMALNRHRYSFLGNPLNVVYPFAAGVLVCASQLKSDAKGVYRIPFLNIAKIGVGAWAVVEKVRKVRAIQADVERSKKP